MSHSKKLSALPCAVSVGVRQVSMKCSVHSMQCQKLSCKLCGMRNALFDTIGYMVSQNALRLFDPRSRGQVARLDEVRGLVEVLEVREREVLLVVLEAQPLRDGEHHVLPGVLRDQPPASRVLGVAFAHGFRELVEDLEKHGERVENSTSRSKTLFDTIQTGEMAGKR